MEQKELSFKGMGKGWKIAGVLLIGYSLVWGMLGPVPRLGVLNETIRNLYYHVTMWFGMMAMMAVSLYYSIRTLSKSRIQDDFKAENYALSGIFLGVLGIITGSVWARFTWGGWWVNDPKLTERQLHCLFIWLISFCAGRSTKNKNERVYRRYTTFSHLHC